MSRISSAFADCKKNNKKALLTFITVGDPDIATTEQLVLAMEKAGANIVELGIPFSDPIAEGPVIQAANARAMVHNIRVHDVFQLVTRLRTKTKVPLVFLLYYNIIVKMGAEKFFAQCQAVGLDGLIVPDLPFEEQDEVLPFADKYGIDLISLVAPSSRDRLAAIASKARGFLYCISSLGVTGTRENFITNFEEFFAEINKHVHIPTALGFGISTAQQVRELRKHTDGIIVGSAIVKKIAAHQGDPVAAVKAVTEFVSELRRALDE